MDTFEKGTFGYDLQFLLDRDNLVVLSCDEGKAQLIVSPGYQGKVFTSTADGLEGKSLGYLNYNVLSSDKIDEQMNGYGGENRFWLGPEGGRYSIFFKPGAEQVFPNWHTPKPIDIEPWAVVASGKKSVSLEKEMSVSNYQGSELKVKINRTVKLNESTNVKSMLGITPDERVKQIAYTTENSITNLNDFAWTNETGTVCIWILDMFNPAPRSLTIVPYVEGSEDSLGVIVTSDYFGEIPTDRFIVRNGNMFLKTDGKYRSKIGLNVKRTKAIAGNYDPDTKRLTITTFDVDRNATYLNQEWNPTKDPLIGDALNAYNDGPLEDGSIMGPFLELESCSPGAFISPGESLTHNHHVFHFIGEERDLSPITEMLFGVTIDEIKNVFL